MLPNLQLVNVVLGMFFFITVVFDVEVTFDVEISGGCREASDCVAAKIRSSSLTSLFTSEIKSSRSKSGVSLDSC